MKLNKVFFPILSISVLFFLITAQSCSINKNGKKDTVSIPEVIDKELWFVNDEHNGDYRPIPADSDFYYYSNFPAIPRVGEVPFPWGEENFYSGSGGYITNNVYIESDKDKPWILQLCISTPGQGDTKAGSPQYKTWYRTSNDNGVTFTPLQQAIVKGYTSMHPIEGVQIGRNGYNVDATRPIVRASNGEIMIPIGLHPWDEENKQIYLPEPKAFMFQDAGVLIGKWLPNGEGMEFEFGGWSRIDHNKSTRGLSEPTIVELNTNGHFAMVSRGSNLGRLDLPCHAWVSFSEDYCRTWSEPEPLGYSNGESFFVTTAHSTLIKSRVNGKTYWIGNLQHENPRASIPRYPLVIGEVDLDNFGVIKETVVEIDTRQPEDGGENMQLSNFSILESDERAEIIVVLTRREGTNSASRRSWYRIKLD
ncbi:MAG: sialidase family protein [Proteiniphilum sp.]